MTTNEKLKYHRHLDAIAHADIAYIRRKDAQYDASWKNRDGRAALSGKRLAARREPQAEGGRLMRGSCSPKR
jgi:hypothetical protein